MTRDAWLRAHAYLEPVARYCARLDAALARIPTPGPSAPVWEDYAAEFAAGVPLLRSSSVGIELEPMGRVVTDLIRELASAPATDKLEADARVVQAELASLPGAQSVADWLLGDEGFAPAAPGFLRHVGWSALARCLRPLVDEFGRWRDEDRWLRTYCPTCGTPPAMAQLVGVDPGRKRYLVCGCCSTRWRHRRTACPFCESDSLRLGIIAVEGQGGLRIDYCESCRGYLKTYDGEGHESVLLLDWTSLHLDVIAHDRGLVRRASSLYELDSVVA